MTTELNILGHPETRPGPVGSRSALTQQIERIKNGQFDESIIPAIVTDFQKSYKQRLKAMDRVSH